MKKAFVLLALTVCVTTVLAADTVTNGTPNSAFQAGKDFASSMQDNVTGVLNEQSANEHLDFTSTPPQSSSYQELPPRSMGTDRQNYCASIDLSTLSESDRKECEAVNYLTGVQNRTNPYTLDKATDPLFARYKEGIELSEKINADTCSLEGSTIPSNTGTTEVCTESFQRSEKVCRDSLTVNVNRVGRSYTLDFAVTALLAKWTSNNCEEDNAQGIFELDLGEFTKEFNKSEYESGNYWAPKEYVAYAAGSMTPSYYDSYRLRRSMLSVPDVWLADNGKKCHTAASMLSGIYVRPIYSQDMIDFLYKDSGEIKAYNTSSFKDVELFKVVSVTSPPGVNTSAPTCGVGNDIPTFPYSLNGVSYNNGPRACNQNPGRDVEVTDAQSGKIKITVSKGSPGFSYHRVHNFASSYIGIAYPIRVRFLVEKYQTTITDSWDDGCSVLKQ